MTPRPDPTTAIVHGTYTKAKILLWYKDVFGLNAPVAAALYEEQLLQDKETLAKIKDSKIDSICCAIRRTTAMPRYPWPGSSS